MKLIYCFLLVSTGLRVYSQQITSTVSVSHYAHPELYLKAGVVCFITDRQGNPSSEGSYVFINNTGSSDFYFNRSGANKDWKKLQARQKTLIPLPNTGKSTVPLRVRYTRTSNSPSPEKTKDLKLLNAISDRSSSSRTSGKTSTPKANNADNKKDVPVAEFKKPKKTEPPNTGTTHKTAAPLATKKKIIVKKPAETTIAPGKSRCMYTSSPAYYTFYYLKVNKELFYSDVFPVAAYSNTTEGEDLLSQAWDCFITGLQAKYSGERLDKLLDDPDNDLQLGLMHLRNPFIPSNEVVKTSPYTITEKSAQQELSKWIKDDKRTYPELQFIKINL